MTPGVRAPHALGGDVGAYLRRIAVDPQTGPPSVPLLAHLQLAHLQAVPFENLHVYHRRGVRTDVGWSYAKIVDGGRGGWCFELNGCFGALLVALGFAVDYVSCQVWDPASGWGPDFDHLALLVEVDDARWFVDVGFGDNCLQPLLVASGEVTAVPRPARIELEPVPGSATTAAVLHELMPPDPEADTASGAVGGWTPQLRVTLGSRDLAEFTPRSTYLQTHPGLSWQERPFATRATDASGGRVTLRRQVLRVRPGTGSFVDRALAPDEWPALLAEHFGLDDSLR